jgi:hypothetical protein
MDLQKAPGMGRKKPLKVRQVLAQGKDLLEDYTLPASISISRETEFKNVADQIKKNLM